MNEQDKKIQMLGSVPIPKALLAMGIPTMVQIGSKALMTNGLTFILFGYYTVYSSLFLALGKGKEGFLFGACRQGFCFIPVILILPIFAGIDGIIFAQPIADVLSFIIAILMSLNIKKELSK